MHCCWALALSHAPSCMGLLVKMQEAKGCLRIAVVGVLTCLCSKADGPYRLACRWYWNSCTAMVASLQLPRSRLVGRLPPLGLGMPVQLASKRDVLPAWVSMLSGRAAELVSARVTLPWHLDSRVDEFLPAACQAQELST